MVVRPGDRCLNLSLSLMMNQVTRHALSAIIIFLGRYGATLQGVPSLTYTELQTASMDRPRL